MIEKRDIPGDPDRRSAWLRSIVGADDISGYVGHAHRRLRGEIRPQRESWTMPELLLEIAEEAVAIGFWGMLAEQALDLEPLDERDANRVKRLITQVGQEAVRAHSSALLAASIVSAATNDSPETRA